MAGAGGGNDRNDGKGGTRGAFARPFLPVTISDACEMRKDRAKKVTLPLLKKMKDAGRRIVALTAYDREFASIADEGGVDIVLVGDSVGNVIQGLDSTVPVRMKEMMYHTRIAAAARPAAHLCADMPFLSYQADDRDAVRNAGRLMKRGAESVKLEVSARRYAQTTRRLTDAGIPVAAHLGLCPQSVNLLGGYGVQGGTPESAAAIFDLAVECRDAGAAMLFLECVPPELASRVTGAVDIPTIGIGSGGGCDGQVLVFNDMAGLSEGPVPGFVRRYAEARKTLVSAVGKYAEDVRNGAFPGKAE